jgi:hypothetical protein
MSVSEPDAAARVARGAAWLDGERPGWAGIIRLHELSMSSCSRCVLGQLFGDYRSRVDVSDLPAERWAFLHGFNTCAESGWAALHAAWLAEIEKRRTA